MIKETLEKKAQEDNETKVRTDLMDEAVKNTKLTIPQAMINREIELSLKSFENQIKQSGLTLDKYKQFAKKTDDDLRTEMAASAENTVKTELVLEAISDKEKLEITKEDMIQEILTWKIPKVVTEADAEKHLKKVSEENIKYHLKKRKALDYIIDNAKIT